MTNDNLYKKTFMNTTLKEQFTDERMDSEQAQREERDKDREFLRIAIELQTAED